MKDGVCSDCGKTYKRGPWTVNRCKCRDNEITEDGPEFEDGPWAEGWEERSKNVEGDIE